MSGRLVHPEQSPNLRTFLSVAVCLTLTSRASHLLYEGTWEGEVGQEGIHLLPWAETWFHSPHLLGPLLLPGDKMVGYSLLLVMWLAGEYNLT